MVKKIDMQSDFQDLKKWNGVLKGEDPIFVLGNGPSIEDINLELLDPYFTVGINRICYIYDPTILFWQDTSVSNDVKKYLDKSKSIKVCRKGTLNVGVRKDIVLFTVNGNKNTPFPTVCKAEAIRGRTVTSNAAIQFADALKASHIILLGIDCKYSNDKTDFWGKNKRHNKDMLKRCVDVLDRAKRVCKIPIYNCGLNDCWRQRKLEDVLSEINPKERSRDYFYNLLRK